MTHFVYDNECYPNVFTLASEHVETGGKYLYEISERKNDFRELVNFLLALSNSGSSMVGYNNLHYDYPMLHYLLNCAPAWLNLNSAAITALMYEKSQSIFNSQDRFGHLIWQPIIRQIDLLKIHHFDNPAKSTSLKALEFNMRMANIVDLPFKPGHWLTVDEIPTLIEYNMEGDVRATVDFFKHSKPMIDFRNELSAKYPKDFTNFNDTKIGKEFFIMKLEEESPGSCYYKDVNGRRQPRQTSRPNGVRIADIIFPYIQFRQPEFNRILDWFKAQTLTAKDFDNTTTTGVVTKGVFKGVNCSIDGFSYHFGTGGIHGSLSGVAVHSDDEHVIIDLDVASYYPNLAIANNLYPEHLGQSFCGIYKDVYEQRKSYSKKSAENAMLKLALNGVYGDSNNIYSPFFDPQYTMSITINGQLLLCLLSEWLMMITGLRMIQINTDGLTVKVPREYQDTVAVIAKEWEKLTRLELESVTYKSMFIRDVNSYLAVKEDGSVKRIGAYAYQTALDEPSTREKPWHKDQSALIVPKAAESFLVHGQSVESFIASHDRDVMDFMIKAKVNRSCQLKLDDQTIQSTSRYFVAKQGGSLFKISPPPAKYKPGWFKKANGVSDAEYTRHDPLIWTDGVHSKNKSVYGETKTGISVGWKVEVCNDIRTANWSNINYDYYIAEAKKLIDCIEKRL